MIEHKDIPDAQLHEPKGVVSATNKQIYIANGASSGSWRRLNSLDIDYSVKANNLFGWNDIADNAYTSGSPLAIPATTRTVLPNNGLATQSDTSRLGSIWDAPNSRFIINDLNASYLLRVRLTAKAAAAAGTPYVIKLELESANGPTVISANDQFIKGGSYANDVSFTTVFYNGSVINNSALKLYVTADTPITVYSIGFVIERLYKET